MDIDIRAIQKTSLLDYPEKISCIVFLNRCNFRCGFCYNAELAMGKPAEKRIPVKDFLGFLEKKKKWLQGVVITGGEPTLYRDLPEFCKAIKKKGYLVKLDTNGSNPESVRVLLKEGLVDFIAMDIKAPLEKYEEACRVKVDTEKIKKSIEFIKESGIDYEFRTTVVPGLLDEKELLQIGELLKGAKKFCLQQFKNDVKLLDPALAEREPYLHGKMHGLAKKMEKFFECVELRGI